MAKKVKLRRVGFHLDMTPLVDIMMLLLIFFMFTATFKSQAEAEQKFVIQRPATTPVDTSKVPDRDIAIIKIAIETESQDTSYFYEVANENDRIVIWERTSEIPEEHLSMAQLPATKELLNDLVRNTRIVNPTTSFAIDADERLRFEWVSEAMDILRRNRATVFRYVVDPIQ